MRVTCFGLNGKDQMERRDSKMNKVAFITGAGVGIGRGIAFALAKEGYNLMIHSATNIEKAMQVCKDAKEKYGVQAFAVQADLNKEDAPQKMFADFDKYYDRLDVYVNNAGITDGALFLDCTKELMDKIVNVNYKGSFFCTQQAAKRMVENKISGNIIIIVSNMKTIIYPTMSIYGSIKAALNQLSKQISVELAPYGIRVNAISPGYVDSSERMQYLKETSMQYIPLKRWASVEEIGKAVLYLTSDAAASITGTCLEIDGGAANRFFPLKKYTQHNFDEE